MKTTGPYARFREAIQIAHDSLLGVHLSQDQRDSALIAVQQLREDIVVHSQHALPRPRKPSEPREVLYRAGIPYVDSYPEGNLVEIQQLCDMRDVIMEIHKTLGVEWRGDIFAAITPDFYEDVRKFNAEVVGPEVDRTEFGPNRPPMNELLLGLNLVLEETQELVHACGCKIYYDNAAQMAAYVVDKDIDHAEALDGAMDIMYVLFGLLLRLGYPRSLVHAAWREVTRANMAKAGGERREDGKRLKPAGWVAPNVQALIDAYTPTAATPGIE